MKISFLASLVFTISLGAFAQNIQTDEEGFQTFQYPEGDTVYTMKKYFLVLLKQGEIRDQPMAEAMEIQKKHQEHLSWMGEQGYLDIAGPLAENGDIRGVLVMRVPTKERAEELAAMDPAVKAGRLVMEIHPWWAAKGSKLN